MNIFLKNKSNSFLLEKRSKLFNIKYVEKTKSYRI